MARPFTRAQALQNAAFLAALRRTGNARLAARELGVHRATYAKRRAKDPAFAADWDAALAMAAARLGRAAPPGEPRPTRTRAGRLQLREPKRGALTRAAEQSFLLALSATANIRLSARAAGFSHATFYARARAHPAFAREMRLALEAGYEQVQLALLASMEPDSHADDAWRHNEPPTVPPMTVAQGIQLLALHQKQVRFEIDPPHIRRRRGESHEAHSVRLSAIHEARMQRARDAFDIAEAARRERGDPSGFGPRLDPRPFLPDLSQVTGWSKADPAKAHPDQGMFGGWTITDWKGKR